VADATQCARCGSSSVARGERGPLPKYCPSCKVDVRRERDRAKYHARPKGPKRESRACRKCGVVLHRSPDGTLQQVCDACQADRKRAYDSRFQATHPRRRGDRHPSRKCEACGASYIPTYLAQRTCGRQCGELLRRREGSLPWPQTLLVWRECAECNRVISHPQWERCLDCRTRPRPSYLPRSGAIEQRVCPDCGETFTFVVRISRKPHRCPPCQAAAYRESRREAHRRRRAREVNAPGDHNVDGRAVHARDGWVCQLCGEEIDREAVAPAPWSPSIDHVMPLSRGGEHSMANVQSAHYWCNSVKSDGEFPLAV
jgi:hypothetical protein